MVEIFMLDGPERDGDGWKLLPTTGPHLRRKVPQVVNPVSARPLIYVNEQLAAMRKVSRRRCF